MGDRKQWEETALELSSRAPRPLLISLYSSVVNVSHVFVRFRYAQLPKCVTRTNCQRRGKCVLNDFLSRQNWVTMAKSGLKDRKKHGACAITAAF